MEQQKDGLNDTGFEEMGGTASEPRVRGGPGELGEGATGASSMNDGEQPGAAPEPPAGDNPQRLGGRPGSPASADTAPVGLESARPGPVGPGGGERASGGGGSLAASTYNDRGDVTGPDSEGGTATSIQSGAGQGDDLANRLGGGEGRGAGMTGGGAATGDAQAERSESSARDSIGAGAPSGGDPGGMGGVRVQGGTGTGRPPGGVSPLNSADGGS